MNKFSLIFTGFVLGLVAVLPFLHASAQVEGIDITPSGIDIFSPTSTDLLDFDVTVLASNDDLILGKLNYISKKLDLCTRK